MKPKIAIVILIAVCVALSIALVTQHQRHAEEKKERDDKIALLTADLQEKNAKLEEQTQVNMKLEGDLVTRSNELSTLSNQLAKTIGDLEKSDGQAKAMAEQLRTAQAELVKKDEKINSLEGERVALGKQMDQLTNSITDLEKLITATEKKLATAQGEKEFLVKELTRLRAEKAELERQFNDVAVLRSQISKIKEEMAIARRLEFIRLNLFGVTAKGGAEKLLPTKPTVAPGTNYDLTVEIRQGGGARVLSPTNAATNTVKVPGPAPRDAPVAPPK